MNLALSITIALILDAIFGEPDWIWSKIPHPAVVVGRLIGRLDQRFNGGPNRKQAGLGAVVFLSSLAAVIGWAISILPGGNVLQILVAAILIAHRSLVSHVRDVANALRFSLADGRTAVGKIVGRDTDTLDASGVAKGAIESAAENLSDGVVAPVFWFLIFGLPGLLVYKVVNTADSMIGYKTQRYVDFGWAAARFDDLLNWIPARLTAMLIALAHGRLGALGVIRRDAPLHRSPNAGWPEAAMATCLDISLSGPRSYAGSLTAFPWVYPEGKRDLTPIDIDRAVTALWKTWVVMLIGLLILALV